MSTRRGGFALISVLVALSILLALAAPFLLAMGHGDESARHEVEVTRVDAASVSARELLLAQVGREDLTPLYDSALEFPDRVELPAGFESLAENGRVQFGGEAWDLQRKIDLNSLTPLLYSNLLGLTARLAEDHEGEFETIVVDGNADMFPEEGYLLLNREVIHYGSREGNEFSDLTRSLFIEEGFQPAVFEEADGEPLKTLQGTLILDLRTVLATAMPFWIDKTRYQPHGSLADLALLSSLGRGGFSQIELDDLAQHVTVGIENDFGTNYGKPERVFAILHDALERPVGVRVRSAADIGAGSIVRIRNVDGSNAEYALVASTSVPSGQRGQIRLPANWYLNLLRPLLLEHIPTETVVERVVPEPVNINTASIDVIAALLQSLRVRSRTVIAGHQQSRAGRPYIRRGEALQLATTIVAMREEDAGYEVELPENATFGPYESWEDFAMRVFKPWLDAATSNDRKRLVMLMYENFMTGRPGYADMGTVPISFHSAPIVAYRAAANRLHPLRTGESARIERQGIANVRPGHTAFLTLDRQDVFEEATRLDRRMPFWLTYPVNTAALDPRDRGTDPSVRAFAHTVALAFPDLGLGRPRFPSSDPDDEKGIKPAPSNTPLRYGGDYYQLDGFSTSLHPEGRDLGQEGHYEIVNSGPRSQANQGGSPPRSHDKIAFAMTDGEGLTRSTGFQFWFRLDDTQEQALFELSVPEEGFPDRNRISLQLREQALILEVMDDAGLDPDPGDADTSPQRTSGRWEIPIADINLQPDVWYHANFSVTGNGASQLELLIDGVPRGQPALRTELVAPIAAFQFNQNPNVANPTLVAQQQEAELHPAIRVESTEGFPPRGVLRIGNELIEYTSLDATTFYTDVDDSFGGRLERQEIEEFVDSTGLPTNGGLNTDRRVQVLGGNNTSFPVPIAPDHPTGSGVELYGYALPAFPQRFLEAGQSQLIENLGAFAVARVVNDSPANGGVSDIEIAIQQGTAPRPPITLGKGIDRDTWPDANDYLSLADPVSQDLPAAPASPEVLAAFNQAGGYALLMQMSINFNPTGLNVQGTSELIGGYEIIRYGSRSGNQLRDIQRDITIQVDGHTWELTDNFDPGSTRRQFVTDWLIPRSTPPEFNMLPRLYTYVIPITIAASGNLPSPSPVAEWVQLYPENNEIDTEWVRYDTVLENKYFTRAEQRVFEDVLFGLTDQRTTQSVDVQPGSSAAFATDETEPYPVPTDPYPNRIGYIDPIEIRFPAIHTVRTRLAFRGDPFTGTSSHAHNAGAPVLPCHRFELDWAGYGALAPRAGRNDRIGLVQGSARTTGQVPSVEWHTVNWAVRHYDSDPTNIRTLTGGQNPAAQRKDVGPHAFQLVGLKAIVGTAFFGAADESRTVLDDSRLLDRAVKFPSGELPAADITQAYVGQSGHQDLVPARGLVDEVAVVARAVTPRYVETAFEATATEFHVRGRYTPTSIGPLFDVTPRQWSQRSPFPEDGGMLWIDGELIAYQNYDPVSMRFEVATDGRGMLGTTPMAHDLGAVVHFVDQVPTEVLANGVTPNDYELELNRIGALPAHGGTVLLGTELLHYTWTRGQGTLAMPQWRERDSGEGPRGLLRGRFGTTPVSGSAGAPVVWFPFRYWDRFRERADDPALAYTQFTHTPGTAWFDRFGWSEEGNSALVDLQCYVRVDRRGRFDDDPEESVGLFRFLDGESQGRLNRLGVLGSSIEMRFVVEYKSGAFDAQTFLANDWKYAPVLREVVLVSEGESRILTERVTAR